ncbi:MAG TPA: class I lanthipeptide [Chitinophaga sp.]|uniref:class I lanthipeptide n=1 Tax=Chitinophaga sp. TaxID=1869181 RepID=UPI002C479784|nr:class I lanthipeptide [Chitinophaga sp.]HVI48219.1 class I lanthipeptide [Chitinophaga sp.]
MKKQQNKKLKLNKISIAQLNNNQAEVVMQRGSLPCIRTYNPAQCTTTATCD